MLSSEGFVPVDLSIIDVINRFHVKMGDSGLFLLKMTVEHGQDTTDGAWETRVLLSFCTCIVIVLLLKQ